MLPADCMVESSWSHYDSLLLETLIPILVLFCIAMGDWVQRLRGKESASAWKTHVGWFVVVSLLVLPTISRRVCQTFQCSLYDDGHYSFLVADLSKSCQKKHKAFEVFAAFMIVAFPLGVPLALLIWLAQFKTQLDDPSMDEQALIQQRKQNLAIHDHPIASFALAYRPRYGSRIGPVLVTTISFCLSCPRFWFFDVVSMFRRLTLTCFVLIFDTTSKMLIFVLFTSTLMYECPVP